MSLVVREGRVGRLKSERLGERRRSQPAWVDVRRGLSTRAKPQAPVSTPLTWDELRPDVESTRYTVENLPHRLASLKADPWAKYAQTRQQLPKARRRTR
jgi:DNA primase